MCAAAVVAPMAAPGAAGGQAARATLDLTAIIGPIATTGLITGPIATGGKLVINGERMQAVFCDTACRVAKSSTSANMRLRPHRIFCGGWGTWSVSA